MKRRWQTVLVLLVLTLSQVSRPILVNAASPVKAFPGAMGYGTDTIGGRGGRVIYVTNLNDSGAGSLRDALRASGPRVVLFKVSGTIDLIDDIIVKNPYLTVAGQTAPGEGVQVRGGMIRINTHDVVVRYLKLRPGDAIDISTMANRDAMTLNSSTNVYNVVVDHCTLIWGPDIGGISFLTGARDSTVEDSIIGEGLYISNHPEGTLDQGGHSMALNVSQLLTADYPSRITIHHNLLTTSSDRNPRVIGGANIDVVDNVIYNWKSSPSQGNPRSLNLIKNYYIRGPMTTVAKALVAWMPKVEAGGTLRVGTVYESGNITEGFSQVRGDSSSVYATALLTPYSMTSEDTPQDAYQKIVTDAGADLQVSGSDGSFKSLRDSVDQRIINNLVNRTGAFVNGAAFDGIGGYAGVIWPALASGTPALDQDLDGMPDSWELHYFNTTSRGSATSSSGDFDQDGYTDLEEYLNQTNPTVP